MLHVTTFPDRVGIPRRTGDRSNLRKYCVVIVTLFLFLVTVQAQSGVWKCKASLPTTISQASASVVDGKIYVFGGGVISGDYNSTTNLVYDPLKDKWQAKAPMPTPRGFLATAVVNGIIYAIGGGYPAFLDVVEAYDPASDTWATKKSLLQPRIGMGAAVVDGIIYIMGGNHDERNCQAYDPVADQWTEKTPMPEGGGGWVQSATAYNGLIYVFGGSDTLTGNWAAHNTAFVYDPQSDTWTRKANMITKRMAHETYLLDGKIYVIGGSLGAGVSAVVEVYDPVNDSWEKLADMPRALFCSAGAVVNDKIYVIGGSPDWSSGVSNVWEYDPLFGTGVEKHTGEMPGGFVLEQNYPNPFNPSTTITYVLPQTARVSLRIYNAIGQEVATLVDQKKPTGIHTVQFNGSNLASGIYLYRLQTGDFTQTRKFTILR
jgi:N-acetylneuraminic acid mutarotase